MRTLTILAALLVANVAQADVLNCTAPLGTASIEVEPAGVNCPIGGLKVTTPMCTLPSQAGVTLYACRWRLGPTLRDAVGGLATSWRWAGNTLTADYWDGTAFWSPRLIDGYIQSPCTPDVTAYYGASNCVGTTFIPWDPTARIRCGVLGDGATYPLRAVGTMTSPSSCWSRASGPCTQLQCPTSPATVVVNAGGLPDFSGTTFPLRLTAE